MNVGESVVDKNVATLSFSFSLSQFLLASSGNEMYQFIRFLFSLSPHENGIPLNSILN